MFARAAVLLILGALMVPGTLAAAVEKKKVCVAPFAPLYHQSPLEVGVHAAELITRELMAQESVAVVECSALALPVGAEHVTETEEDVLDPLSEAKALMEKGREEAQALRFDHAVRHFRSALEVFESHILHLDDFSLFVDAHLEMALALFRAGREDESEGYISDVLRLDFDRRATSEEYPSAFVERFEAVKDRLRLVSRSTLQVTTSPPGAEVILDGQSIGRTPLRVTSLVPGRHYVRIDAPGIPPTMEILDLVSAIPATVELSYSVEFDGPLADLLASLAGNRIGESGIEQASKVGREVGADFIVFGALQRGPRTYQVRPFMLDVASQKLSRLSDVRIDLDFLGAAIQIFQIAEEIGEGLLEPPAPISLPAPVFDGVSQRAITYSEVVMGPPVSREDPSTSGEAPTDGEEAETVPEEPPKATAGVEPTDSPRPLEPMRPHKPLVPVAPEAEPEERRRVREGPIGAGAISAEQDDERARPEGRPTGPLAPVTRAPTEDDAKTERTDEPERREPVQVGGARGRLLDPELEPGTQRFAAIDIDEVVIIKDEDDDEPEGWPWWAWGLTAVGLAGLGAGGWYAATEIGAGGTSATLTIKW